MFALIHDGRVAQVSSTTFEVHPSLTWVNCPDDTMAGDLFDGITFSRPVAAASAPEIPQSVTKVQAVLALHALPGAESGKTLLDDVEAAVAAASDPRVALAWDNASQIDRTGLFVLQLAKAAPLNMTDAQIDALFITASQISV